MSVVIETTLGDVTIDLFMKSRPRACLNFLKLCKMKYYNYNLFHTVSRNFIAQTGDPTGSRNGGESIFGVLEGPLKRYFEAEKQPRIKHTNMGLISFVGNEDQMIGSQFFMTLGTDLTYLDEQHCVFGEVVEGLDVLELLNEAICDIDNRPYQDIRITHTVVLDDPMPDPKELRVPSRSPSPSAERLHGGRIAPDEEIDESAGKSIQEIMELQAEREAKARATILEMVGDIPDAEMAPPENVLFVCKLNPVTTDDDLEIIFSRFGKIKSCEVIRDKKTGDSLQYAFVEFEEQKSCEDAYFKMDNVLIDDRRIHVDFSQSVAKIKWHGKGRGVTTYDDKGRKNTDFKNDIGNGRYASKQRNKNMKEQKYDGRNKDSYNENRAKESYDKHAYRSTYSQSHHRNSEPHRRNVGSSERHNYRESSSDGRQSSNQSRSKYSSQQHYSTRRYEDKRGNSPDRRHRGGSPDRANKHSKEYRPTKQLDRTENRNWNEKTPMEKKSSDGERNSKDSRSKNRYKQQHEESSDLEDKKRKSRKKKKKQQSDSDTSSSSSDDDERTKKKRSKKTKKKKRSRSSS